MHATVVGTTPGVAGVVVVDEHGGAGTVVPPPGNVDGTNVIVVVAPGPTVVSGPAVVVGPKTVVVEGQGMNSPSGPLQSTMTIEVLGPTGVYVLVSPTVVLGPVGGLRPG